MLDTRGKGSLREVRISTLLGARDDQILLPLEQALAAARVMRKAFEGTNVDVDVVQMDCAMEEASWRYGIALTTWVEAASYATVPDYVLDEAMGCLRATQHFDFKPKPQQHEQKRAAS